MTVINVRTDPETEKALTALTADGTSRSAAIRKAIIDAADAAYDRQLHAESEMVRNDPADRAEARQIQKDMEYLRAW